MPTAAGVGGILELLPDCEPNARDDLPAEIDEAALRLGDDARGPAACGHRPRANAARCAAHEWAPGHSAPGHSAPGHSAPGHSAPSQSARGSSSPRTPAAADA